jgi:hypothetical protein
MLAVTEGLNLRFIARDAVGAKAPVVLDAAQAHVVHVERRIGEDVVERADASVRIVVVVLAFLMSPRRPFSARFALRRFF